VALPFSDTLACGFARLLLFTDPYPLPTTEDAGWDAYCGRLWRPGKPSRERWASSYRAALEAVYGVPTPASVAVGGNEISGMQATTVAQQMATEMSHSFPVAP